MMNQKIPTLSLENSYIYLFIKKKGSRMFKPSEKVVYPGHGVAQISRVISKFIAGRAASFFELRFIHKDMTILVPVDNASFVGIRKLSSCEYLDDIFKVISQPATPVAADVIVANWNKRNKEYLGKIRTGDLKEISSIYRDLHHLQLHKELSFGEKHVLQQTEQLLAEEIALVQNSSQEKATMLIRALINNIQPIERSLHK